MDMPMTRPLYCLALAAILVSAPFNGHANDTLISPLKETIAAITNTTTSKVVLKPFIAHYQLLRAGKSHGSVERQLYVLDKSYRLRYKSSIKWLIFTDERNESSEFIIDNHQIRSLSYKMERSGSGPDRSYQVIFDRDNQQLITGKKKRKKNQPEQVSWDQDWLDPISYQQQILLDLKQAKTRFDYRFVDRKGRAREYHFKIISEELLTLPYGNIKAIKVQRLYDIKGDKKTDRQMFAWFAPELDYTLVRIWKAKSGTEQFDIQLTELKY
jgi:hypothetical protein